MHTNIVIKIRNHLTKFFSSFKNILKLKEGKNNWFLRKLIQSPIYLEFVFCRIGKLPLLLELIGAAPPWKWVRKCCRNLLPKFWRRRTCMRAPNNSVIHLNKLHPSWKMNWNKSESIESKLKGRKSTLKRSMRKPNFRTVTKQRSAPKRSKT